MNAIAIDTEYWVDFILKKEGNHCLLKGTLCNL